MIDLAGAELELEVARVMGDAASNHCLNRYGYADPTYFSPLKDGCDTWEVHQWLRAQGYFLEYDGLENGAAYIGIQSSTGEFVGDGDGPDDATALCRAVVAIGVGND